MLSVLECSAPIQSSGVLLQQWAACDFSGSAHWQAWLFTRMKEHCCQNCLNLTSAVLCLVARWAEYTLLCTARRALCVKPAGSNGQLHPGLVSQCSAAQAQGLADLKGVWNCNTACLYVAAGTMSCSSLLEPSRDCMHCFQNNDDACLQGGWRHHIIFEPAEARQGAPSGPAPHCAACAASSGTGRG